MSSLGWILKLNFGYHNKNYKSVNMENYRITIPLNSPVEKVFGALTNDIPLWWTEMFEGISNKQGESFTIHFGESVFKQFRVQELEPNTKAVWYVEDSLLDIPSLENKKEWIGTTIIWEIIKKNNDTELQLTHMGLQPDVECYQICSDGWRQFTASLKSYVETGVGTPYLNSHEATTEITQ